LHRPARLSYRPDPMPRLPRGQVAGHAYHVLNRGNGEAIAFHKDSDYAAFCELLATTKTKYPVKVFCVYLMPNHFQGRENGSRNRFLSVGFKSLGIEADFAHDSQNRFFFLQSQDRCWNCFSSHRLGSGPTGRR